MAKSGGWELSALGVVAPQDGAGVMTVGAGRFERSQLHVSLAGALPVPARIDRGRVVYSRVLPSVDRLLAASSTTLEELLVLHDERAPRELT